MLRLGDNMSDSREVLVDAAPAAAADDVIPSSSIPEVGVVTSSTTTSRDADAPATTEAKSSLASGGQRSKTVINGNSSCVDVTDVQATPIRTPVNNVRIETILPLTASAAAEISM